MSMALRLCVAQSSKRWSGILRVLPQSPFCFARGCRLIWWHWISAITLWRNPLISAPMIWRLTMSSHASMAMAPVNSLSVQLQQIGLRALLAQLDDFLARAAKSRWSPCQILDQLVQAEVAERFRAEASNGACGSPASNVSSPWRISTGHGRRRSNAILSIAAPFTLDFIAEVRNLVLVGRNGLGKMMIAQNICMRRCWRVTLYCSDRPPRCWRNCTARPRTAAAASSGRLHRRCCCCYADMPNTPLRPSPQDQHLARRLHQQAVPLTVVNLLYCSAPCVASSVRRTLRRFLLSIPLPTSSPSLPSFSDSHSQTDTSTTSAQSSEV